MVLDPVRRRDEVCHKQPMDDLVRDQEANEKYNFFETTQVAQVVQKVVLLPLVKKRAIGSAKINADEFFFTEWHARFKPLLNPL